MASRFINTKTALLYEAEEGQSRKGILIFGDEVETRGAVHGDRVRAKARGVEGWLNVAQLGEQRPLEMYFIDVGQGDATFIVTPGGKKILVDGGINRRALGFLSWKYQLEDPKNRIAIDLLVLSHADGDHLRGLAPIVGHPQIDVRRIVHSGIATFAPGAMDTKLGDTAKIDGHTYLVTRHSSVAQLPAAKLSAEFRAFRDAVAEEDCPYQAVDSETGLLDIGDPSVKLIVLGPRLAALGGSKKGYLYLGSESMTINGHSVVLKLTHGRVSLLLPGDINSKGAANLMEDAVIRDQLSAQILKGMHHGSQDFDRGFLSAVRPQITVVSSGDETDYGHPRAVFVGAVGRSSRSDDALVFSTEIAGNFVEIHEKEASGEPVPEDADPNLVAPSDTRSHHILYKRRLHGMINVRTDGQAIYAARRVASGTCWEAYGPVEAAP
ncbi:MAG: MBL fold metallo-hydrolase [Byssovorax sp.]